jgi:hypothetical protein
MSIHIRTAYLDEQAVIRKARYHNGSTALVLDDATTGERLAVATVCMAASGESPPTSSTSSSTLFRQRE